MERSGVNWGEATFHSVHGLCFDFTCRLVKCGYVDRVMCSVCASIVPLRNGARCAVYAAKDLLEAFLL